MRKLVADYYKLGLALFKDLQIKAHHLYDHLQNYQLISDTKRHYLLHLTIHDLLELFIYLKQAAWQRILDFETMLNCQSAQEIEQRLKINGE